MKIYPSFHDVVETEKIKPKDIPLSYLATDASETEIVITKEPIASQGEKIISAMPYEEFDSPDAYLFDENGERVDAGISMQRIGDKYYFIPQNAIEFVPDRFSFSVLIKKDMTYLNDRHYNIKVGCVDGELNLSERLISIFGDAPRRGISPLNVSINNQDVSAYSLINSSFEENDFVFIESDDGIHYADTDMKIEFDDILDHHTNIWLSVKSFGEMIEEGETDTFQFGIPTLYDNGTYQIPGYNKVFNLALSHEVFPESEYEYINMFEGDCPILLLEKPNKGYIIVSEQSFFDDVARNAKLIYEILVSNFLTGYYRSPEKNIWITDAPVDYIALKESKYGFNHERVTLDEMLENENYRIGNEYSLIEVKVSDPNVVFQGITGENELLFRKLNNTDPKKQEGMVSVYTTKQTVMHYKKQSINRVESDLIIEPLYEETGNYLVVHPYKSTSLKIHSKEKQIIRIPEENTDFFLVCKDSIFKLIPKDFYDEQVDGLKMAVIKIVVKAVTKNYDMRILGGGLPEEMEPDYNLLDIGHIKGRPYRIGSALIIVLPKRLEPYKELIKEEVSKHIASGDYPVILFE